MAVARAWTGSLCAFVQQQQVPALVISRQCCSCHSSASQPAVSSSSFVPSWTVKSSNRLSAGRRRNSARFSVLASQEAGTSTLLVQEVEFTWKGKGSEVLLTGDFLQWDAKVPLEKGSNGSFTVKKKLPVGKFAYKFIVDGEWMHSVDSPMVPDGSGGFNNEVIVADPSAVDTTPASTESSKASPTAATKKSTEDPAKGNEAAKSKPAAVAVDGDAKPKPAAVAADGDAKPKPSARAKKAVVEKKSLEATMREDVIPQLSAALEKEEGLTDLDITFEENQLKTSFTKGAIPYCHWAFFPDGTLEGSRGASLTSHGSPPSTIEPFLVDENKITAELVVFWIRKRLFAQKILSVN